MQEITWLTGQLAAFQKENYEYYCRHAFNNLGMLKLAVITKIYVNVENLLRISSE